MSASQTQSSGQIPVTAGTQVKTGSGLLHKVILNPASAACTVTVYDNTAASGTVLCVVTVQGTTGFTDYVDFYGELAFTKGLFVVVAGAGATAQVTWE